MNKEVEEEEKRIELYKLNVERIGEDEEEREIKSTEKVKAKEKKRILEEDGESDDERGPGSRIDMRAKNLHGHSQPRGSRGKVGLPCRREYTCQ